MVMHSEHEADGEWHVGWEDGVCAYEDEFNRPILVRAVHRHPFGTEYAEVDENSVSSLR